MTECERLIAEGKLSKDFLLPEMRECEVPVEMKKLWALQIDMVHQVMEIAKRHNLTCFAIGGTVIGAIRHKGFIPWDDDIDLAFKRDEYNAFLQYAQEELTDPYFLQIVSTDRYFYKPFAVLRNSNATCIYAGDGKLKCNNGAIIHIFPLDGYTNNKRINRFIKIEKLRNRAAVSRNHNYLRKNALVRCAYKMVTPIILGGSNLKHYIRHEKACTEIYKENHDLLGIQYAHFDTKITKITWDKHVFDSAIMVPFEYTEIPIPVGYEEMLRVGYGDYMQLPPEEQRINKHSWEMALDTPYKEYCANKYGVTYDE